MIFAWSDKLSVGHPLIDAEHRCLIEIINRLAHALSEGFASEIIGVILCDLSEYCAHHFEHEEREMMRLRYSDYPRHKAQHDIFIQQLSELVYRFESQQQGLSRDTLALLTSWLTEHITVEDRKLARLLTDDAAARMR